MWLGNRQFVNTRVSFSNLICIGCFRWTLPCTYLSRGKKGLVFGWQATRTLDHAGHGILEIIFPKTNAFDLCVWVTLINFFSIGSPLMETMCVAGHPGQNLPMGVWPGLPDTAAHPVLMSSCIWERSLAMTDRMTVFLQCCWSAPGNTWISGHPGTQWSEIRIWD